MFRYYTYEEVVEYAKSLGYDEVDVERYDYTDGTCYYEVSFGSEYTETWTWEFEDLDEQAVDYLHEKCGD